MPLWTNLLASASILSGFHRHNLRDSSLTRRSPRAGMHTPGRLRTAGSRDSHQAKVPHGRCQPRIPYRNDSCRAEHER